MHDWWLSLCAHALGATCFIPLPLVHYRQHGQNLIGAKGIRGLLVRPRRWGAWLSKMHCLYRVGYYQGRMLRERWPADSSPDLRVRRAELDRLLEQGARSGLGRCGVLLRCRVHAQHPALTLLLYAQALLLSPLGHEQSSAFTHGCHKRQRGEASQR